MTGKTRQGNFFEDFSLGQVLRHATARTLTTGDAALYTALYGSRFAVQSSDPMARALGYRRAPLDDLLVFNTVFGKTVPDISLNAVANLGYAECLFHAPAYPGDTVSAQSEVIGLRETSDGKAGIVYVRSAGFNQEGEKLLDYVRWAMVKKRGGGAPAPEPTLPEPKEAVEADQLGGAVPRFKPGAYDTAASGSDRLWSDYRAGEKIDHVDGMTVEEAEHMLATRLYQNPSRVHFNQYAQAAGRFGRRLVYGGHVIGLARALSFNGLANAFHVAAINAGRHVAPLFAGDTLFAWSEIIDKAALAGREDVGALRLRTFATRDRPCADFPGLADAGHAEGVVLDLDYWVAMPL